VTKNLRIHVGSKNIDATDPLYVYGSDALFIKRLIEKDPGLKRKLHEALPYVRAEVVWASGKRWREQSRIPGPQDPRFAVRRPGEH